ncbi:MAG: hypothetical protein M3546_05770 [Actinomycetota bacterium]|nr:hypothetical protein [Actinomycetota bacterium]
MQDGGSATVVLEQAVELQALGRNAFRVLSLARQVRGPAVDTECICPKRRRDRSCPVEELADPAHPLEWAGRDPEVLERDHQLEPELDVVLRGPVEGSSKILAFGQSDLDVECGRVVAAEPGFLRDGEHPLSVAPPGVGGVIGCLEPLGRELADRLEHPETLLSKLPFPAPHEALVEERCECVEVGVAHDLDRLEGAAPAKHGQTHEQRLLVGVQQVVRPGLVARNVA